MENKESILLSKFEKCIGFSSNLFDGEDWRNLECFIEGYKLAEKELKTEK